jgi:uncharacterized RDD family membrane protein YckC
VIRASSAGFGRRFAALIYDGFLLIALLMPYTWVVVLIHGGAVTEASGRLSWWAFRAGALAIMAAYYVLNWTRSGQTLGMRAWRLRTLTDSGKRLQVGQAVVRFCWGLAAWLPFGLGVLWLYADPEHLALHDRLSRTRVVVLARSRDRNQRTESEDRGREPPDQHGVQSE